MFKKTYVVKMLEKLERGDKKERAKITIIITTRGSLNEGLDEAEKRSPHLKNFFLEDVTKL